MTKNTYGTGSFVLMNLGPTHPPPDRGPPDERGVAARRGGGLRARGRGVRDRRGGPVAPRRARDHRRGRRDRAARRERAGQRAGSCSCRRSPGWGRRGGIRTWRRGARHHPRHDPRRSDPGRRGVDRSGRSATSSTRSTPASGRDLPGLRVDGGASVMDLLCQFQADVLGVPVQRAARPRDDGARRRVPRRPRGGVWDSTIRGGAAWRADAEFEPSADAADVAAGAVRWRRGLSGPAKPAR